MYIYQVDLEDPAYGLAERVILIAASAAEAEADVIDGEEGSYSKVTVKKIGVAVEGSEPDVICVQFPSIT